MDIYPPPDKKLNDAGNDFSLNVYITRYEQVAFGSLLMILM